MKLNNQSSYKVDNRLNQDNQSIESSETVEYLTVQEFAERAGVSNQAVYERIKKDLSEYATRKGGRMMISSAALDFVGNKADNQVNQAESIKKSSDLTVKSSESSEFSIKSSEKSIKSSEMLESQSSESSIESSELSELKQLDSSETPFNAALTDYLMKENARLLEEIQRKDSIIEEKDRLIAAYAEKFAGYVEQMAAIAQKEQEISTRALDATGRAQYLHAMSEQADAIDAPQEPQEAEKKRSWWKRKGK